MELKKFKNCVEKKGIEITTNRIGDITWAEYECLSKEVSKINFKCDFRNGMCRAGRRELSAAKRNKCECKRLRYQTMTGCCGKCHYTVGYLEYIKRDALKEIADLFKETVGFWRPDVGCILPRKYRSVTCQVFVCSAISCSMNRRDLELLENFCKIVNGLRAQIHYRRSNYA